MRLSPPSQSSPIVPFLLSVMIFSLTLIFVLLFVQQQAITISIGSSSVIPLRQTPPLPTREPRPPLYAVTANTSAALQFYFLNIIPQGETRLARIVGGNIKSVIANWLGMLIDFYPVDGTFYGLLAVDMEQPTSLTNELDVYIAFLDGTHTTLTTNVQVTPGNFISQTVMVQPSRSYLVDAEMETRELTLLHGLTSDFSRRRMWDSTGFQLPIANTLTSPFGAYRNLNGVLESRHTGWDIDGRLGTPIQATASGRVTYTGTLDIRGNYVMLDHGFGVYSAYAHLGSISVQEGQLVAKGDTLGILGDTGRTNGAHFHWEMSVNGDWVNSVQFMEMWQP